jgi:hypothetical protein
MFRRHGRQWFNIVSYEYNQDRGSGIAAPLREVRRLCRAMEDRVTHANTDYE